MPTVLPVDDAVGWPPDEGVIGVVGVAPWATLDFLRALYRMVPARKDWHYPRVLCDINCKLPSRGRHLELGERDPSPFIAETIGELAAMGATVVVVPCNTAHILYDRWALNAPVAVPSIVDATVTAIRAQGARRIAVFASEAIACRDLYGKALRAAGLEPVKMDAKGQALVSMAIAEVKVRSELSADILHRIDDLLQQLTSGGMDGAILGCTELAGLEARCRELFGAVAESNAALAVAALQAARVGYLATSAASVHSGILGDS